MLSCLEREEESVSTEFAEDDIGSEKSQVGLGRIGERKWTDVVNGRPREDQPDRKETLGTKEGSLDFGVRYL